METLTHNRGILDKHTKNLDNPRPLHERVLLHSTKHTKNGSMPMSKTEKAKEIAKANPNLSYGELKTKIQEEVPCSRTLAHNAITQIRGAIEQTKPQEPKLIIEKEEKKEPAFIEEPRELEEIKPFKPEEEAKPIEEIKPEELLPDLEVFRDMMRGFYTMILGKDGFLGEKYGRDTKQCVQCSDQMYRWLYRRYGEELLKYDTVLLVLSHGALIGGIMSEWLNERRKRQKKEQEMKKEPEKK